MPDNPDGVFATMMAKPPSQNPSRSARGGLERALLRDKTAFAGWIQRSSAPISLTHKPIIARNSSDGGNQWTFFRSCPNPIWDTRLPVRRYTFARVMPGGVIRGACPTPMRNNSSNLVIRGACPTPMRNMTAAISQVGTLSVKERTRPLIPGHLPTTAPKVYLRTGSLVSQIGLGQDW